MSFSSGTFSINSAGQPVVTGTVISSTAFNALTADLATGLSTCVLKDGTQTMTASLPMAGFILTGLGAGASNGNSLRYEQLIGLYQLLSTYTTAGDILQATGSAASARLGIGTARQVPTVNAGATALAYQNPITLATEQASTSGTSIDFTGIPAGARRISINFAGVSTNGTSKKIIQIGDAGGFEVTGYGGSGSQTTSGPTINVDLFTDGFGINSASAAHSIQGTLTLTLVNPATFLWSASGILSFSDTAATLQISGTKALSQELSQVRITTQNGTDAFDAGLINIAYE